MYRLIIRKDNQQIKKEKGEKVNLKRGGNSIKICLKRKECLNMR